MKALGLMMALVLFSGFSAHAEKCQKIAIKTEVTALSNGKDLESKFKNAYLRVAHAREGNELKTEIEAFEYAERYDVGNLTAEESQLKIVEMRESQDFMVNGISTTREYSIILKYSYTLNHGHVVYSPILVKASVYSMATEQTGKFTKYDVVFNDICRARD